MTTAEKVGEEYHAVGSRQSGFWPLRVSKDTPPIGQISMEKSDLQC